MANIPISALPSVDPTGYTNQDLLVLVNYQLSGGTTSNTPLSALTSYVLSAFTGNTSATCISDLYVTNVYGCSPITVNNDLILNYAVSAGTNSDDILVRENTGYIKSIPVSGLPFSNVTGLTFNNGNFDLTVGSDNGSAFTQSLSILATDMTVTGGTYNSGTGVATFTTNSGNTFNVSGFLTGYTDTNIYTIDGSLTGNRVVDLNGYSLTFNDDIIVNTVYVGKGSGVGSNISIGDFNTFSSNSFGTDNIAIGDSSLAGNVNGFFNTAVGHLSLSANDGGYNTAIGYSTLGANTSGQWNTSVGSNSSSTNTIGNNNTSTGYQSLFSNFDGSYNTAIGVQSLYTNDSGSNNTSIGYYSGYDVQTGSFNTFVGSDTGGGIASGSYNTIIGANVIGLSSSLSNNIIIADGQGNQRINVDSAGNMGIGTSTPSEKLEVSGKTKTINFQMTSGATNGYVLTSDSSGNSSWQPQTYKTVHTHGFNNSTIGNTAGARWSTFGALIMVGNAAAYTSNPTYSQAQRLSVIPKTGFIKSAKISWYITGGNSTQNHILTFRNNTTSTTYTVTTTLAIGPSVSGIAKTYVVSSLNIPVTENDVVHSVIQSPPIVGTALSGVYMVIDYIIE